MATIYVGPLASGNGTGSSAANAMAFAKLNDAVKAAGPGGTVMLLADKGAYNVSNSITLTAGGTDSAPITLKGVSSSGSAMDITINGTRPAYKPGMTQDGNVLFKLLDGANNLVFDGFDFHNVQMAFRLGGDIHNITIQNMEADNLNYFVGNFASGTNTAPDVTGLTIRNCDVNGFTKAAVLLQYNTNNVTIDHVVGDSKYETTDIFAMGIHMYGTVHNVTVQNCSMLNCMKPGTSSSYWNGDGYTTESGTYSIHFINCLASGNGDAGFDIKSKNTVLDNCISEDNGRNYRFWGDATLNNCGGFDPHVRGGIAGQAQIWVGKGAHVTVIGGHFDDSGSKTTVGIADGGILTFKGTEMTHAAGARLTGGTGISGVDLTLVHSVTATGSYSTNGDLGHTASTLSPASTDITGTDGADVLTAQTACTIKGLGGNDTITGSPGNDHIIGGAGTDIMRGNAGADLFQFSSASESKVAAADQILDFQSGVDHIDLANIDAIGSTLANDAFKYIGSLAFSHHAGELRLNYSQTGFTIVQGDTNGDGIADFAIKLTGHLALTSGDFIL